MNAEWRQRQDMIKALDKIARVIKCIDERFQVFNESFKEFNEKFEVLIDIARE